MINAILIDDEDHCISRLQTILKNYCQNEVRILTTCTDIESGYEAIINLKPDLVFLDIQINAVTFCRWRLKVRISSASIVVTNIGVEIDVFVFSEIEQVAAYQRYRS